MLLQNFCIILTLSVTLVTLCMFVCVDAASIENDVLHFSYELTRWLDAEKRPCQDFFGYVCGKSVNSSQAQFEQRTQQEQQKFDKFLWGDSEADEQLMDAELKLKQFYDSCKNARSLDDLKSSFMYRMSGGWPAIDDSALMLRKRRNMTWMNVIGAFHDAGLEYFFKSRVEVKSNKRIVHLQPDGVTRYTLRKFEQLASDVMQDYAVDAGRARLIALEILNFERNRRDIIKEDVIADVQELTYEEFKNRIFGNTLQIDWDTYFKKILGKPLKSSDTILVKSLPKLTQLFELLQNTSMTRLLNWIWIDYLMDKSIANCQILVKTYFEPIYQHIVERSAIDKVQMAQMYSDIGRAYDELLSTTSWIDEISKQNSKQFLGRIIHLTLNGDAKLDTDYNDLTITKRNFYRNLEKAQRFLAQQQRHVKPHIQVSSNTVDVMQTAKEYLKIFFTINALLPPQQNLTTPLNYILVGERFAEHMIAGGSSSTTPGAWRSMDSEREFATFKQCMGVGASASATFNQKYNLNDLILKLLAQQQTLHAFEQWQQKDAMLLRRLNNLLTAGRWQLTMRKLYFVGSLLTDCRQFAGSEQRELLNSYFKNSVEFTQAFGCRLGDNLYARNTCKVL